MYICMHVCMCACMCACVHVCMYACMCACVHVCMHLCMHACIEETDEVRRVQEGRPRPHMPTCPHANMPTCTYAHMPTCPYAHAQVREFKRADLDHTGMLDLREFERFALRMLPKSYDDVKRVKEIFLVADVDHSGDVLYMHMYVCAHAYVDHSGDVLYPPGKAHTQCACAAPMHSCTPSPMCMYAHSCTPSPMCMHAHS